MTGHEETRMSKDIYFQYNEYYHDWMTRADYNYLICVISKQQDSVYVLAKHRTKKSFPGRWVKPVTRRNCVAVLPSAKVSKRPVF